MRDELPEGWAQVSLSECVDVLDLQRVPVNSDERAKRKGRVPYYGATGQVGWIDDHIFDEELLLLGEDGAPFLDKSKAIAYIIAGKSWVNNHAHVLRACSEITKNHYLKFYLDNFDFHGFVNGTTRMKLTQASLNSIPVRLAPLPEQRRIAERLEKLLAEVEQCKERMAKIPVLLKRFRQSVLAAACSGRLTADWRGKKLPLKTINSDSELPDSWKAVSLGSLISDGPQNGLYKPASFYGRGTLIVRIDAFYDGTISAWSELKRLHLTKEEQTQFELRNGDILINRVNSPKFLGKAALVRELSEPCVYESNMMRLRLDLSQVLPNYAILYLQSFHGLSELQRNAKHAVNQSSINQQDAKAVSFNLPSISEQQEIVRRVDALFALADRIEERYQGAKKQVDKLTQSILAKAFRGELVPTEAELAAREGRDYESAAQLLQRIDPSATKRIPRGASRRAKL